MGMGTQEQVAEFVGRYGGEQAGDADATCALSVLDAVEENVAVLAVAVLGEECDAEDGVAGSPPIRHDVHHKFIWVEQAMAVFLDLVSIYAIEPRDRDSRLSEDE